MSEGEPNSGTNGNGSEPEFLQKMDAGLRYLLQAPPSDILRAIERDRQRLAEVRRSIEQAAECLAPDATAEERRTVYRLQAQRRYRELLPDPVFGSVILPKAEPFRATALVKFSGNRDDLTALGLEVGSWAHDTFVVAGTMAQLANLAAQRATLSLSLPRPLLPMLDNAGFQSEVHQMQKPVWTPTGYNGTGVVVGVVDDALDITHQAFRKPNGDTRLLYYWVQKPDSDQAPGKTPYQYDPKSFPDVAAFDRGRLYTAADLNQALKSNQPYGDGPGQVSCQPWTDPHGTWVAGMAGGSKYTDPKQRDLSGAAPEALLVHVALPPKLESIAAFENDVIAAIDFVLRAAELQDSKQPVVVNLSQGTQFGPHDGSTPLSAFVDAQLNSHPWRSVVVAAGNANGSNCFQRGTVPAGKTDSFQFQIDLSALPNVDRAFLEIWYSGPALDLEFAYFGGTFFSVPAGKNEDYGSGPYPNGYSLNVWQDEAEGKRHIRMMWFPYEKNNKTILPNYLVTIRLKNSNTSSDATYDAWIGLSGWEGKFLTPTPDMLTLTDPACTRSMLTVGACRKVVPADPQQAEEIEPYSGAGPSADGRIKPEMVTTGGDMYQHMHTADPEAGHTSEYLDVDDTIQNNTSYSGTSFAAPLVAGAAAQLFEALRSSTNPPAAVFQDDIKGLLTAHAAHWDLNLSDAKVRNQYGYGRLRLKNAVSHFMPAPNIEVWIKKADDDYGALPYPGFCFWASPDIKVLNVPDYHTAEVNELIFNQNYTVCVMVRNLGLNEAWQTRVKLYYSLPDTAPKNWVAAKHIALVGGVQKDVESEDKVDVPPLSSTYVYLPFTPRRYHFTAPPAWNHFCLLAVLGQSGDLPDLSKAVDPWELYIKGHHFVALHNVIINVP